MKFIISRYLTLSAVLFTMGTIQVHAQNANLPQSAQLTQSNIEIIPEIKIESGDASIRNSALKDGDACNFDDLEEVKGKEFAEMPMAETISCDEVDCHNLRPAALRIDNYRKLKDAPTIAGCD